MRSSSRGSAREWRPAPSRSGSSPRASRSTKGEPLFEIDTDKVTQEVESDYDGVLLKIALAEGEAPVGQTIAWIGKEGEEVAGGAGGAEGTPKPARRRRSRCLSPKRCQTPKVSDTSESNGGRIKASPLARRIARERGVDLAALRGTGPDGRIVAEDVERGGPGGPPACAKLARGRGRVGPADEHPQDDRAPPDRRLAGARLPADGDRRHDARERARRRARAS